MQHLTRIALLAPLIVLFACAGDDNAEPAVAESTLIADRVFVNGTIWTGERGQPDASVLAIHDGKISYVGSGDDVTITAGATTDLEGRFLMPGFIDNHVHLLDGGSSLASVELRDANTRALFVSRIAAHAATLEPGRWVLNGNWDHELWGGELPRRAWIDEQTGDTPVFVMRLDGHMGLANSAALKLAGITAQTPVPDGGEIIHDNNGEPTGVLKDNAMNLVWAVMPPLGDEDLLSAFRLAQDHALSLGLTELHAVVAGPADANAVKMLRLAEDQGILKIRIKAYTALEDWTSLRDQIARDGKGEGRLRWLGVKGLVDGSLGSTTAWFHKPYTDHPQTSGFPLIETARLKPLLAGADKAGLQLAIHGIGDRAIDVLIDALRETAGPQIVERRYRIEHFQHPSRAAIVAAADSGIIASMQPYHAIDDGRWAEGRIGPERIKTTYAFRSILDAGGLLTFGSDWPVAPLSPLHGVYAATTRRTIDGANPGGWQPQEKISVAEALRAYTAMNAFAVFEEASGGTLAVGKRADLVRLNKDPRAVDPAQIPDLRVLETVIAGETVYRATSTP